MELEMTSRFIRAFGLRDSEVWGLGISDGLGFSGPLHIATRAALELLGVSTVIHNQ